jgi:hypothetical protein
MATNTLLNIDAARVNNYRLYLSPTHGLQKQAGDENGFGKIQKDGLPEMQKWAKRVMIQSRQVKLE